MPIKSIRVADYNKSFVEATRVVPVAAAYVRIQLTWKDENGQCWLFDIYPNNLDNFCAYKCGEPSTVDKPSKNIHKYNFFQELSVERVAAAGAGDIKLILFDPTGHIIEDALLNTFVKYRGQGMAAVSLILEYGWVSNAADGKPKPTDLVGGKRSYILHTIDVSAEYTGVTYTLGFTDLANSVLNTSPAGWASNVYLLQPSEGEQNTITFPHAVLAYWLALMKCEANKVGDSTLFLIKEDDVKSPQDDFWKFENWEGKPHDQWTLGSGTWLNWLNTQFGENIPKGATDVRFTYNVFTSGQRIGGSPKDVSKYDPTISLGDPIAKHLEQKNSWQKISAPEEKDECSEPWWQVPDNECYLLITKDARTSAAKALCDGQKSEDSGENQAAASSLMSKDPPMKTFVYLSPDRDVHNTVVGLSVSGTDLYALYMTRHAPDKMSNEPVTAEQNPKDKKQPTEGWDEKGQTFTGSFDKAFGQCQCRIFYPGAPLTSTQDPSASKQHTDKDRPQAELLTEATASFITLPVQLEVLGDPDLLLTLQKTVQIDFKKESAQAMMPWIRGTYFVQSITDRVRANDWTTSLDLMKVGPLWKDFKTPPKTEEVPYTSITCGSDAGKSESPVTPAQNVKVTSAQCGGGGGKGGAEVGASFDGDVTAKPTEAEMAHALAEALSCMPILTTPTIGSMLDADFSNAFGIIIKATDALGLVENGIAFGEAGVTPGMAAIAGTVSDSMDALIDPDINLAVGMSILCQMIETPSAKMAGNVTDQIKIALAAYRFGYDVVREVVDSSVSAAERKQSSDDMTYTVLHSEFSPITFDDIKTKLADAIVSRGEYSAEQVSTAIMHIASFQLSPNSTAIGFDLATPDPYATDTTSTTQPTDVLINEIVPVSGILFTSGQTPIDATTIADATVTTTGTPTGESEYYWPPPTDPRVDPASNSANDKYKSSS